jgi:hypothetical protein
MQQTIKNVHMFSFEVSRYRRWQEEHGCVG